MTAYERAARPPLDGLRAAPFSVVRADEGDGMTLDGWGAVFNRETVIDSWEGRFREKIAPGAMKRSFRETPPKIQFDHGRHPTIGSIPIAKLERVAEETDPVFAPEGGAHIVGRFLDHPIVDLVRQAIEAEAINGMSFRFSVMQESWQTADGRPIRDDQALMVELARSLDLPDDELPVRILRQVKVPEMGPVVWPAYAETSVSARSIIDLGALRRGDPEQRRLLAGAMLLADIGQQDTNDDAQRDTDEAVERTSDDEQQDTESPVVERPSSTRGMRAVDVMVRRARDAVLDAHRKAARL